jgi:hypothetical protein
VKGAAMKLLKRLFFREEKPARTQELMKITNAIGPLLDKTAHDIFSSHTSELLTNPITYIIAAVWGAGNEDALTSAQVQMNKRIIPVIDEILRLFGNREMNLPQQNAVNYLIRSLLISKISLMVELLKNQTLMSAAVENKEDNSLAEIEPIGNA